MIDISIIIISYNTKVLLQNCLDSVIKNTKDVAYEIIVVDNASIDGSLDMFKDYKKTKNLRLVTNSFNVGFAKANNQGMELAHGQYILLLNSDTLVKTNVITEMTNWMREHSAVSVATCKLLNKDGSVQGTGGFFPTLIRVLSWMVFQDLPFVDMVIKPFHPLKPKSYLNGKSFYAKERELDWITGAFFMLDRKLLTKVGYFDEDYFMYTEDVDYCYKIKMAGYKIVYLPYWSITHLGGASGKIGYSITREFEGIKQFYKKHYPAWQLPILRILLKTGALLRIVVFGLVEGKESAKIYAKAFTSA